MTSRICLRSGILLLLASLCLTCQLRAQSQGCVNSDSPSSVAVQETKISIVGVEFQSENPLLEALRAQLASGIQRSSLSVTPEEPDSSWVNRVVEPIRGALQEQGYFRNSVEGTPYLVRALASERRYVLRVVIQSGPKYRLGKIEFASVSNTPLAFTEALLRQQIPLKEGEPLNVSKIRDGIEAIGKLYGSRGYIDATAEPDTTIDEEDSRIDLLIKIDEHQRYTIAKIEFLGLDSGVPNKLKTPQEKGEPINFSLWENFFQENKPHLPADASSEKNIRSRRDVNNSTVDIILDFRPCPKAQPSDD